MKKINNYSTQYKIISHSFAQNFTEQLHNQNQNYGKKQQNCIRKHYQKMGKNL